ncbi:MAG: manganese efflux pump MntP family protein [Methanomassiliicoccus sp.]|nr:manganese efflux pump MntP family protein [Methanomassiliicoccus sp.]
MDLITTLLIAVGLAMDAFAVSIAKGISVDHDRRRTAIMLASLFGIFQALMPVIGFLAGVGFQDIIRDVDHWIAFGLLAFIGGKMIYDAAKSEEGAEGDEVTLAMALVLAVATSIDALMVGLGFAFLETSIVVPVVIIGVVTFVLSLIGFEFGSRLGELFGKRVRIVGGAILILIGLRILLDHLFFGAG